jgi:hypothetical protein
MHYKIAIKSLALLAICPLISICSQNKDTAMDNQQLTVKAKCRGNDQCLFEKSNILLDISITNNQKVEIGFPLEYVRKTGPVIKLIDAETEAEAYLPTLLADWALKEKFTSIQPGKSVLMEWVITSGELQQFGGRYVDLSAEITVFTKIQVNGELVEFKGSDVLRIVSKDKK